ncbi:FtsQ-type POTRA domain-containing protein [Terriglobus albidus]|uniref:Cell division protein FtsQ n=1 Tax=Terriglobus albidus TaxID=1592106 RepID=A0A5B9EHP2_9BACT|nr:FtsQ-type POTRA domain-containing protein [Terriglobus albidus]QEE29961.1 FtsQ-type POTRA domain-containing protein [Terriglobus albidus]
MPDFLSKRASEKAEPVADSYPNQEVDRRRRRRSEEDFPDDDAEFFRASQRVRVRKGLLPQTKWGRIAAASGLVLALGGMTGAVIVARNYLLRDDRFRIASSASIEIAGNTHVSRPQMLSIFGEDVERNIFRVPLTDRREQLEGLPWVEHATVMRLLPNRLRVAVVERTPVAYLRQSDGIRLVDANGVILDLPADAAGDPRYSFPVVTGIVASEPSGTRGARMKLYQRFIADLDGGGAKISDQVSEVDVSNPEDVKALIPDHGMEVLVHFGDDKFLERYQKYQQHLPEWKQQYPRLASADMRYETQVVLEMAKDTGGPPPVPAAADVTPGKDAPAKPSIPVKAVAAATTAPQPSASKSKPVVTPKASTAKAAAPRTAAVKPKQTVASAAPVRDTSSGIPDDVASRLAGPAPKQPAKPAVKWKMPIAKPGQVARPSKDLLHQSAHSTVPSAGVAQ